MIYLSDIAADYQERVWPDPRDYRMFGSMAQEEASRILADVEPAQAYRVPLDALLVMRSRGSKGETLASLAVASLAAFVNDGGRA